MKKWLGLMLVLAMVVAACPLSLADPATEPMEIDPTPSAKSRHRLLPGICHADVRLAARERNSSAQPLRVRRLFWLGWSI